MKPEGDVPGASLAILMVTSMSLSQGATKTAQLEGREGGHQLKTLRARSSPASPILSGKGLKNFVFSLG